MYIFKVLGCTYIGTPMGDTPCTDIHIYLHTCNKAPMICKVDNYKSPYVCPDF